MGLFTKVVAAIATRVIAEMESTAAAKAVYAECYEFCKSRGIPFVKVIHLNPADFMADVKRIGLDKVTVKTRNWPVEYTSQGLQSSMRWCKQGNVITVNTNYIFDK